MSSHETKTLCNLNVNFPFGYNKKIFKKVLVLRNDPEVSARCILSLKGLGEWFIYNTKQQELWQLITSADDKILELLMAIYHGLETDNWTINKQEKTIRWND